MTVPVLAPHRVAVDPRLDLVEDVIRRRSIETSGPQRIVSPDGRDQSWLLDLRPVLLDGAALSAIAALFWERFRQFMPFQMCGLETASIPLLSAIAIEAHRHGHRVNAFIVRKERKTSGLARDLEGDITDAPVVVVDDLTNSAASLEKVRVVLADRGLRIARAFVVVDFQAAASLAWRASQGIEIESLFDGKRFGWPAPTFVQPTPLHRFQPIWSSAAPGANHFIVAPRSTPACDGRSLYVGTDGGALRAVDAATGGETWSFPVPATGHKGIWSSPAMSDGRIIFGAYDGAVYCLASATGEAIWRAQQADWVGSSPAVAHRHGLVIVGLEHATPAAPGSIAALDLASGAKVWDHPVAHFVHGTPALARDETRVFIGTNGGELLCLETTTGALVWRYQADGPIKAAAAVSPTGVVVVGAFDGGIHLLDAATGKPIAVAKTAGAVYSTPLILDGRAFVGSQDKHLHVVALADGSVVKTVDLGARIFASPALLDGLVFVGTTAGRLFGIDPVSLAIVESLQLPDRIVNAPLLVDDGKAMVVPVMGNRLFGFRVERLQDAAAALARPQPEPVASERVPPLSAAIIDGARAEELYFRIDEPTGVAVSRPFSAIPSRRLLGAAMFLMLHAAGYRELGLSDVKERVLPALLAGQARVFLYGMQPIGLVTWANLSADAEERLVDDGTLPGTTGWCCGERTWIIDIVAPFGGSQAMLDKVRRDALRGRTVHRLQPRSGGGYARVSLLP